MRESQKGLGGFAQMGQQNPKRLHPTDREVGVSGSDAEVLSVGSGIQVRPRKMHRWV